MCRLTVLLAALLLAGGLAAPAAEADPDLADAEEALRAAGMGTDAAALLGFFRERTPPAADHAALAAAVGRLGDDSFAVRQQAAHDLVRAGPAARPLLRAALKDPDREVVSQAKRCLQAIERAADPALAAAAARLLAARRPAGAAAVLLAYLPAADEQAVEGAVLPGLAAVGVQGGRADPALVNALADREPARRAAAAHVLGAAAPGQRPAVRRLLADPEALVRFRAASALVRAGDKQAVPALIALLAQGPTPLAYRAEDLLCRVAGPGGAPAALGAGGQADRRRCRAAWDKWWQAHQARADLAGVGPEEPLRGVTVIVERNSDRAFTGRVWACGRDGKALWEFDNVRHPDDVQVLPGRRLLLAEGSRRQVTERDFRGKVLWRHAFTDSLYYYRVDHCQRLPNGNTFILNGKEVLEITRAGKKVFSFLPEDRPVFSARKMANGRTCYTHGEGIGLLDASGREVGNILLKGMDKGEMGASQIEPLPNGNFLLTLPSVSRVVEVDAAGQVVWQRVVTRVNSATPLPNGNVLVTGRGRVAELDRSGGVAWRVETQGLPVRARRY
jgi:hypothetical protein